MLTTKQKDSRVNFVIDHLNLPCSQFISFDNLISLDEKWFYLQRVNQRIYLSPEETIPIRKTQSKKNIIKVMFLVAVSRPRRDYKRNEFFDGKFGCYPPCRKQRSTKE